MFTGRIEKHYEKLIAQHEQTIKQLQGIICNLERTVERLHDRLMARDLETYKTYDLPGMEHTPLPYDALADEHNAGEILEVGENG